MKIIFFGTPEFAATSLKTIIANGYEVAAVVTMPDKVGGRGNKIIESDVKKVAQEHGLEILQPEKLRDPKFLSRLKELDADLFVVIAFRMLPEVVWSMPRLGTFNLHASLLPQLRGAAPINHAIISGLKTTGVTTFLLNAEIDKGNILLSSEIDIAADETAGSLHDKLMDLGANLVIDTIKGIESGGLKAVPQVENEHLVAAPKIFKDFCKIDFNTPAFEIERLVRGLYPYPAAWCKIMLDNGKTLDAKILKVAVLSETEELAPGECRPEKKRIIVATSDGMIEIMELQPAGKKPMDAKAFLAGYSPQRFF